MKRFYNIQTNMGLLDISLTCQSLGRLSYEITLFPKESLLPSICFYLSQTNQLNLSTEWEADIISPAEVEELSELVNDALTQQKCWNWDYES